jgi:hypothetical protein
MSFIFILHQLEFFSVFTCERRNKQPADSLRLIMIFNDLLTNQRKDTPAFVTEKVFNHTVSIVPEIVTYSSFAIPEKS